MNRDTFSAWVNTLIRAWENHDAQAAANLFNENATYQENPFDEPLRGRAAIRAYWSEMPRQQDDIHTDSEVLEVSETSGVARWSASYTRRTARRRTPSASGGTSAKPVPTAAWP
jgi:uncharacterized protein (TIGR02246 family)